MSLAQAPLGQTLAHAFGDGPAFRYPYLWSWGGKEVEADGKTVVLDSKATVESVKFSVGFWLAFLANTISSTSNGASIYLLARSKPEAYMAETGKPIKDDCFHSPLPKGPAGQFSWHVPSSNLLPTYGKNQETAKDFLRWFHSKEIYNVWFTSQQGFSVGATKMWEDNKLWQVDQVMAPFRSAAETFRRLCWARRPFVLRLTGVRP